MPQIKSKQVVELFYCEPFQTRHGQATAFSIKINPLAQIGANSTGSNDINLIGTNLTAGNNGTLFIALIFFNIQLASAFDYSRYQDADVEDVCKNYVTSIKQEIEKSGIKKLPMEIFTNGRAYKLRLKYLGICIIKSRGVHT